MRRINNITLAIVTALLAVAAASCSLKKNTAASRQYSAFITRYNIYYNGDTHFKETLDEMEKKYEDDYSQFVFIHPAEARQNEKAPQPAGDFTRSIEKAQKAIQVRSMKMKPKKKPGKSTDPAYKAWMKRDEYNPFLHNAWMMMGRSQFLNGDFLGAAATFFYISKHFTWLPEVVTESKLWQARAYVAIDWLFEAETIITRIKADELTNKTLQRLYNITYAAFCIKSNEHQKAVDYVKAAIQLSSGSQKTRLNFLLGQLYESLGDKEAAYKAFDKAGSSSSASYRTKFNARIKQSEVFTGSDIEPEVKALRRMTRYDRNKEYLDQIYYAIGNLYLSRGDTAQAIDNYALAVEKSTRSGIDKALAQITLGTLYYDQGSYDKAQPCYSEAIPKLPENYPDYKQLKRRSDFLDELAVYAQNVHLQDSLLTLSYMTPEEQTKVAERLIEELKERERKEAELAKLEEYRANQAAEGDKFADQNAPNYTINTDNSWYFYNPSTVTAGKTDFQRRWGSRKLEDNWRRRNKVEYAMEDSSGDDGDDDGDDSENPDSEETNEQSAEDAEATQRENDPHFVEYYLKQIPKTDAERAVCNDVIQEGLYNEGVILKDKLEDFPAAEREFTRLLTRYPDNIYRLDAYYNLYLMYVRSGNLADAERYRLLIINDFPDSSYGQAMRDPNYIENLRLMEARQEQLYAQAYEDYMADRNAQVHKAYGEMARQFPMSKLMPKFMFIDALAYVTENNPEKFKEVLNELIEKYPDTDLSPYVTSYLKGVNSGRKLHSGGSNMRGMIWDIQLGGDSIARDPDNPLEFDLNPDDMQLFILLYPTDEVSANQLLYMMARHNFSSFAVKDYDLEQMNFGRLGLLIIKPFDNVAEINHYRSVMAASNDLALPPQVRPVVISDKNFKTLISSGASFDEYFRYVEDKTYRDTEEQVLPPEFFGPSEGIPTQPADSAAPTVVDENIVDETIMDFPEEQDAVEPTDTAVGNDSEAPAAEPLPEPLPEPELKPEVAPAPEEKPAAQPVPSPSPATTTPEAPKAETPKAEAPKAETPKPSAPAKPAAPAKNPTPAVPEYPTGSEGDDPLFDL